MLESFGNLHRESLPCGAAGKPPPAMPALQLGADSRTGCSASDTAPCECTWERGEGRSEGLGPCTYVGDLGEMLGCRLCLAIVVIGVEINK